MALIMHQHIFIFSFLTIKEVTSQQKDRKSGHKELKSRFQDPTSRHNYLTNGSRAMPPYI